MLCRERKGGKRREIPDKRRQGLEAWMMKFSFTFAFEMEKQKVTGFE
jgi:hypothetical protein